MKNFIIALFLLIIPLIAWPQNDTIFFNNNWKETKSKKKAEYYRIIDHLPNGIYKCTDFYLNNHIQMVGYYKDQSLEKQDSTFDFYTENGLLLKHYKFINNEFHFGYETQIVNNAISDTFYIKIDTMASFHDGDEDISAFIATYLKYPSKAYENNINGVVRLSFIIDQFGKINNVKVEKSLGFGCDEASIQVVKQMPYWNPGKYRGQNVKCKLYLPIRFSKP